MQNEIELAVKLSNILFINNKKLLKSKNTRESYPWTEKEYRRALIIDDESDIRNLLSNILKKENIQSVTVGSLAEADEVLQSNRDFSVVFLDNHLPDGLGIAYISQLRKNSPASRIVMITAQDTNPDRVNAHANGANFFLKKPFSVESILQAIRRTA